MSGFLEVVVLGLRHTGQHTQQVRRKGQVAPAALPTSWAQSSAHQSRNKCRIEAAALSPSPVTLSCCIPASGDISSLGTSSLLLVGKGAALRDIAKSCPRP